jgi:hypothetical protein
MLRRTPDCPPLMQLAGYRIQAKVKRASFNKINPFNLFLKENKTAENQSLRRPAPGREEINHGRPSFTGAYQKHMSDEYKLRKVEYEQKAKELNNEPKPKLTTESGVVTWRRITDLAANFTNTINQYDVHFVLLMVPPTTSMNPKMLMSNGYGKAFYALMDKKETAIDQFVAFCRGGDINRPNSCMPIDARAHRQKVDRFIDLERPKAAGKSPNPAKPRTPIWLCTRRLLTCAVGLRFLTELHRRCASQQ